MKFEVKNLVKSYNNRKVLEIFSCGFKDKKIYALYGPNGSGKTTFLNILALLAEPSSGEILYEGAELRSSAGERRNLIKGITLVQQNPYLFNTTVGKNISYGLRMRGMEKSGIKKMVEESLAMVGLQGFGKKRARELSGGEIQRVAIARGLALKPEVFLLDEPTANIDEGSKAILEKVIVDLNKRCGTTVIFSTHDLSMAYRLSDDVIPLFEGKIVPSPVENILHGKIIRFNDVSVFDTGNIRLDIVSENPGAIRLSINPEEILISRDKIQSSARNSFGGRIIQINDDGKLINVIVDIGEKLKVKVTRKSYSEMGLNVGAEVYLTFKSAAVKVF